MFHHLLDFVLFFLMAAFLFLLVLILVKKSRFAVNTKKTLERMKVIKENIDKFINEPEAEFKKALEEYVRDAAGKGWKASMDEYLLGALELNNTENKDRLRTIARSMDFSAECLNQIKSRKPGMIALGSRRAGLYNFTEAAQEMVAALEYLSSGNQFEILMGLARMGQADAMEKAMARIEKNIIINERAVVEILSAFPGGEEKIKLYRNMIESHGDYIAALFLKAAGKDTAMALTGEIISVLHTGEKETRTAAIRALATLGEEAPDAELIKALEDPDWEVRAMAAKALGPITKPESSLALFRVLKDQQWWVRQNATSALVCHHGYETLFILAAEFGDEYTKDSIMSALEDAGSPLLLRSIKILTV